MNKDNNKKLEDIAKELFSKKVDNDAKDGKELLEKCEELKLTNSCTILHKQEVINYISRIDSFYSIILINYAKSVGLEPTGIKEPINCNNLKFYVDFINDLKDRKDKGETLEDILKIYKDYKDETK